LIMQLAALAEEMLKADRFDDACAIAHAGGDDARCQRVLGAAAMRLGKDDEALAAFEACAEAYRDDAGVLVCHAELLLGALRYHAALAKLKRAMELDIQGPIGLRARALVARTAAEIA
jgi:tetratricopeptide (TPR) repeat protein